MAIMFPTKLLLLLIILAAQFWAAAKAQAASPQPYRDKPDVLFRRAPMAESARSMVVPLSSNVFWAFDSELLRTHTIWKGSPLNLWGPPYSGEKNHFIADYEGEKIWSGPALFPWFGDEKKLGESPTNRPAGAAFLRASIDHGKVLLSYSITDRDGGVIEIKESAAFSTVNGRNAIIRAFEIGPARHPLYFLAAAQANPIRIERPGDRSGETEYGTLVLRGAPGLIPTWHRAEAATAYAEEIITETGSEAGNKFKKHEIPEHRAFVKIEPHSTRLNFVLHQYFIGLDSLRVQPDPQEPSLGSQEFSLSAPKKITNDTHLTLEHFSLPREAELLATGMDWLGGDLLVTTWVGDLYQINFGPGGGGAVKKIAAGLNEPLGLQVIEGNIYVVQKGDLTLLSDENKDGYFETHTCITDRWGYSGNYHSYSFGPVQTSPDKLFIAITGQRSRWDMIYGGFGLEVDLNSRKITPICSGLRAPNGVGLHKGELFVADNQGNWIGACRLNHIQKGAFYGFPSSSPAPRQFKPDESQVKPPAVWFPRKLAPSASEFVTIPNGVFGPFSGQMLIGDFQNATVLRVSLEKVKGEWQGAVWPFAKGFYSGVNRLSFGPDNKLYVGGLRRTWAAAAPQEASLDRLSFTGETPFEVLEVKSRANGFEFVFTEEFDRATVQDLENYLVTQFTYKYHKDYGSPEFDHHGKPDRATELPVKKITVLDAKTFRLEIEGLREKYVTAFTLEGITSKTGKPVWHDTFYYTLNQIGE